jgi:hypothetical protein
MFGKRRAESVDNADGKFSGSQVCKKGGFHMQTVVLKTKMRSRIALLVGLTALLLAAPWSVEEMKAQQPMTWARIYPILGIGNERPNAIQQTNDGGYIIAARTDSSNNFDVWVLKLRADGMIEWQYTYGGPNDDAPLSIQQTSDGGYIVAGWTESFLSTCAAAPPGVVQPRAGFVLKLNPNGSVQWAGIYGHSFYGQQGQVFCRFETLASIQQTTDGGYIAVGSSAPLPIDMDAWVLKLDANGNVQWERIFSGPQIDMGLAIRQTRNGGYIITGSYEQSPLEPASGDLWVLQLNANGDVVWQYTYGGPGMDMGLAVQELDDGGFIIAGQTAGFPPPPDIWVLRLNSNGTVGWSNTYGGPANDETLTETSIQQTADGGFIVVGRSGSFEAMGGSDVWILKLYANGNVQWSNLYGGPGIEEGWSIRQTSDGGYIVAGLSRLTVQAPSDVWVLKLNAEGNIPACPAINIRRVNVVPQDFPMDRTTPYPPPSILTPQRYNYFIPIEPQAQFVEIITQCAPPQAFPRRIYFPWVLQRFPFSLPLHSGGGIHQD